MAGYFPRLLLCLVFLSALVSAQQAQVVAGQVVDPSGAPVSNAVVISHSQSISTDRNGHFEITVREGADELTVRAQGFAEVHVPATNGPLRVVLSIARPEERVSVSGSTSTTLSPETTTFDERTIRESPTVSLDETLRQSPSFSLFRRTPSWVANPTTQGVSLQGTGSSAASRALVLENGIPLNDPFGGWVYWGRVPVSAVSAVELQTGAGSSLYGSDALGGVVSVTEQISGPTQVVVDGSYGNLNTSSGSLAALTTHGPWTISGALQGQNTDGYVPVPSTLRGDVDSLASSTARDANVRLDRRIGQTAVAFLSGSLYGESRQNGTVLQTNGATVRELRSGLDWSSTELGSFAVRLYGGTETLRQTFTSISADRNTESLTRNQGVPASQFGTSLLWSRAAGGRQLLVAGFETRLVSGESDEYAFVAGKNTSYLRNGGTQFRLGFFGEDRIRLTDRLLLTLAARIDRWSNYDGVSATIPVSGDATSTRLASRSDLAFDPRATLSYSISRRWTVAATGARAFRAPTLNELYRSFRVGNVLTNANPELLAERSTAVQGSVVYSPVAQTAFRLTGFWNRVNDPVANLTQSTTPTLITRVRQNIGALTATGMEAAASVRIQQVTLGAAYQYAHSTVTSFAPNPTLVGLWVPQVARHTATMRASYSRSRWTVAAQGRYFGRQYDDDRNQFPLTGAFVTDASISHSFPRGVTAYISGDNIFDRHYQSARTPVLSIGPGTVARVGLRWDMQASKR